MSATKGYLPLGTSVPPTIMGLTGAEGCLSAACGAASPLCRNTRKDATTITAATNAPTRVAHRTGNFLLNSMLLYSFHKVGLDSSAAPLVDQRHYGNVHEVLGASP